MVERRHRFHLFRSDGVKYFHKHLYGVDNSSNDVIVELKQLSLKYDIFRLRRVGMKDFVAVLGSINSDTVLNIPRLPHEGESLSFFSTARRCGGKGANQAVGLAKLKVPVVMLGAVGDDETGNDLLRNMKNYFVDADSVKKISGTPTGAAYVLVEPDGANRILAMSGANFALDPVDVNKWRDIIASAIALVIQLEIPISVVARAVELATLSDVPVCIDAGPIPPHTDLTQVLSAATLVSPNRTELSLLTHMPTSSLDACFDAIDQLRKQGLRNIVSKLDVDGAAIVSDSYRVHIKAKPVVARDTTGAGDAFMAAMVRAWCVDKLPLPQAVQWGNLAGAITASRKGIHEAMPTYRELLAEWHGTR